MPEDPDYPRLFRAALRIRLVEERIVQLYPSDKIQSPVHLSIGQEAVAVGICDALAPTDLLFSSYRGHAFYLAKGGDLNGFFAELYGKATGVSGGKAGSMHLAAPEVGFQGCSAIVASSIPHAVGAALAARRLGKEQRVVAVFGDGATEEGVFHESLNFAALRKVPVILVCENNAFAVHSSLAARQAYRIAELPALYGIPYARIEAGHDFVAVRDGFRAAVDGRTGPVFIEVTTHRHREHVGVAEDFDAGYRARREKDAWDALDPLVQDTASADACRDAINAEIDAAVAFAEASPWPGPDELLADVI